MPSSVVLAGKLSTSTPKKGAENAVALTTVLTATVITAAEAYGEECGNRLPVPLIAALDEAANVVRWPRAAQPLQALRFSRHHPHDESAVLRPGSECLGRERHGTHVVCCGALALWRRRSG